MDSLCIWESRSCIVDLFSSTTGSISRGSDVSQVNLCRQQS